MNEILLYTKAAKLTQNTLVLLRENGYIPIQVADESAVRILPAPLPQASFDAVMEAAILAVAQTKYMANPRDTFGTLLSEALAQGIVTRRAETSAAKARGAQRVEPGPKDAPPGSNPP